MKTKLVSLFVALFATTALWAYDFSYGGLYYNITSENDKTVEVAENSYFDGQTGYHNRYSGYTSIHIPDSVTHSGITYRVTAIEEGAFRSCESLTSITIPNSVTSIGVGAFYFCEGLTSITIPNSVTSIGKKAFSDCTSLTSVTIGNSVTSIGGSAFYACQGLTKFNYTGDVQGWLRIDMVDAYSNPLYYTKTMYLSDVLLTKVVIPEGVTNVSCNLQWCTSITSVIIPNSVTTIGESAFSGCSNLETVVFGENVQDIGDEAFRGCQNIYEMTVRATKVPNVAAESASSSYDGTFRGVSKLAELHVPAESVKKYKIHPVWGLFDVITAIPCVVTLHCDNVMGAVTGAGSYQANEQVNISANPNLGYRFRQWSDGVTTNPRTLVVVGDTTLTAEFEEIPASEYTVSVVVDAEQNGAVQMTLTAVPDAGYQFTQWSDGNTDNPRTILVTENMTLSATFSVSTNVSATPTNDDTTGTRKLIRNSHVLIQRDGKTYTVTGEEVE